MINVHYAKPVKVEICSVIHLLIKMQKKCERQYAQ